MLFASFDFLLFLTAVFAGYWLLSPWRWARWAWVLAASYFFYTAAAKPVDGPPPTPWYFVGLLVLSTIVDYVCAQRIAAAASAPASAELRRRGWLLVSVVTNLGLLAYFKYTGFLLDVIADAGALLGVERAVPTLSLLLPVGISFYTFQSLSYTIDVYRGRIRAESSFLRFAVFVAFFPQLVAGPIVRAADFLPQLVERPRLTREDVDFAIWRIAKGLIKKVLIADLLAVSFIDRVFAAPAEHSSLENLLALYAFTLQIYADFSGYSDIAIGTARLFGFRLPENFDRPYQAVDVADFWRRWHITLSTWLRDYVYYPLGGNRRGELRTYVNLWITLFLVGIWHGAGWTFVVYAALQASAMVYSRACRQHSASWPRRLVVLGAVSVLTGLGGALLAAVALQFAHPWTFGLVAGGLALFMGLLPRAEEWPLLRPVHVVLTLHFCVLSRVFFRAEDLDAARSMSAKLLEWDSLGVRAGLFQNELLASWFSRAPALSWLEPVAEWSTLLLLLVGFALHYTPRSELAVPRFVIRAPALLVGVGLAALIGFLSLLLAGPRANIYFAF